MAAMVSYLAITDITVIRQRLGRSLTADEYLRASASGDKRKIEQFAFDVNTEKRVWNEYSFPGKKIFDWPTLI